MNYPLLISLLLVPGILVMQIYLLGVKMSQPEKMIKPIPGALSAGHQDVILQHKAWLDWAGFKFLEGFQFGSIHVAVFQQGDTPRFLSFMCHQRVTLSAESYLEDQIILDTSNSGSIGLFPRPEAYAQSFPDLPADKLWNLHLEGEAELMRKFGCKMKPLTRPYLEILVEAMRIRMVHNRSQFLWPARVLYRFLVTRYQIRNKTIEEQFP